MKFSYEWLRELTRGLSTPASELERLITMKTAECEGVEAVGGHFAGVSAVRVLTVDALPKGKNRMVTVDVGNGKQVKVVCGAPNVRPGMMAAWVRPGTELKGRQIGRAVIEGVESEGMLASAEELGINRDHSGLLVLHDVLAGEPLSLKPDFIIEIDNKSLTHRPDLWGHFGMAREVAAITNGQLTDPVDLSFLPTGNLVIRVEILDSKLCPRYSALVMRSATVQSSPLWMQARLESVGLNAISNLVDVTNYVLAELPQPMHAFDADKIAGETIFVRLAKAGETLAALNGETYVLDPADLIIADESGPIALAGVIGGTATAISSTTSRIILESANFNAASVRLSSVRHKLRTDASMRFEKSLDPENTVRGLARAVELLRQISPGIEAVGGITDNYSPAPKPEPIFLPNGFIERKLGVALPEGRIGEILQSLGFAVSGEMVTVPSWRATKDISHKADLVEEIGRIIGYDSITPMPPLVASTVPPPNLLQLYLRHLRSQLVSLGFSELHNYSFVTEAAARRFQIEPSSQVGVQNPIASELTHLRSSLLPGLFESIVKNLRYRHEFRLFEIGSEIHPRDLDSLPAEIPHMCALLYNQHGDERDFYEMKRVAECLFSGMRLQIAQAAAYEHPTRTGEIEWRGTSIGRLFELHPSLFQKENIEGRAFFIDVNVELALSLAKRPVRYVPPRKYPSSSFDLSAITSLNTPVAEVEQKLTELGDNDLISVYFVRQFSGAPLDANQKSVTYNLKVGAADHTLSAEEVTAIRNRLIEGMIAGGYKFRAV